MPAELSFAVARAVFAVGIGALGLQLVWQLDFPAGLVPAPAWLPARAALALAIGQLLAAMSVALLAGWRTRAAAAVIAMVLTAILLGLHVPRVIALRGAGGVWAPAFEVAALAAVAWLVAAPRAARAGGHVFGFLLPLFGLLHIVYVDYIVAVIPSWIPGVTFWAYATALAHIAAGLAIVGDVRASQAARWAGIMFASWVVLVHVPRAFAYPDLASEWTSLFIAIAMAGAAWLVMNDRRVSLPVARAALTTR